PAPACADQKEAGPGAGLPAGRPSCKPAERLAAQPDEQERRAQPEQGRGEKHVDGERERRVRVGIDDRRKARARGQPIDEPRDGEREQVEIEPLPERLADPLNATPTLADVAPEGGQACSEPGSKSTGPSEP